MSGTDLDINVCKCDVNDCDTSIWIRYSISKDHGHHFEDRALFTCQNAGVQA